MMSRPSSVLPIDLGLDAARQRLLERAEVPLLIGDVGQLLLGADVVAEDVLRRRHAGFLGQMIDERRQELGLGRRLLHELRKFRHRPATAAPAGFWAARLGTAELRD